MKHVHGIEICLTDLNGNVIPEATSPNYEQVSVRFPGRVGSCNVAVPAGNEFRVLVKLHKDFKIYKAEGIKIVVVADATCVQEDNDSDGNSGVRQRYGLWWLDVGAMAGKSREVTIEGFTSRKKGLVAKDAEGTRFLAPEVDANSDTATTNWITEEYYCANKGCIAVFVERGKLVKEARSSAKPGITPIRYDEFLALNSPNANPYVFEFRNVEPRAIRSKVSRWKDHEFGREDDLVTTEILYDSDSDIPSEEEAVATDSSDSESTTSGDSEVSEDASPPPLSRKRKAPTPRKSTSYKKQRTTEQKQAEANATNATLWRERAGSDQDDEELPLPNPVKMEPAIKQEPSESPAPGPVPQKMAKRRRGSAWRSDLLNDKRQAEIIDLTMDDSADEEGQGGGRGAVQALGRKFANLGGGKKQIKGKTGVCEIL